MKLRHYGYNTLFYLSFCFVLYFVFVFGLFLFVFFLFEGEVNTSMNNYFDDTKEIINSINMDTFNVIFSTIERFNVVYVTFECLLFNLKEAIFQLYSC